MLPITEYQNILQKNGNKYTLEETKALYEFLHKLAETHVMVLNNLNEDQDEKCDIDVSGIER
jgi:hypothetical protein